MPATVPLVDPSRCVSHIVLPRRQQYRCSGWKHTGHPHPKALNSWTEHVRQRKCQIACLASSVSAQSKAAGSQQGNGTIAEATLVAIVPAGNMSPLGPPWQVL